MIARDDFAEEEMRLFLHASNFRRMRKAASASDHVPIVSMVGPTGAGSACARARAPLRTVPLTRAAESSLIKRLNPVKPPVVAFQEQQIPTTSNVNAFASAGWSGLGPVRILDLEGDDGGLPLMECVARAHSRAQQQLTRARAAGTAKTTSTCRRPTI